jgi:Cu-Zn family superoxide dismutase
MRRSTVLNVGLLLGAILTFGVGSVVAFGGGDDDEDDGRVLRARAVVAGAPGSGIEGVVTFRQVEGKHEPTPAVQVDARVRGLSPGRHGFHIHENGVCEPPSFTAAGGHYDPGPNGNSNPDANHPYHMGDLPNLIANRAGVGRLHAVTTRVTLSPSPTTVFDANGSAVIVHLNPDQGITGPPGSGVSGGPRVACGVIEMD